MPRLSERELQHAIRLVQEGRSQHEVANILNVAQGVISRAVRRLRETGEVGFRHGGGRARGLTNRQEHLLRIMARRNPTYSMGLNSTPPSEEPLV